MKTITFGEMKRMDGEEFKALMPVTITFNGEAIAIMDKPENVIVVGDLHPRVRDQFLAKSKFIRTSMGE